MKHVERRSLAIFAHPDDIPWTSAGTIAQMTRDGEKIDQIMVTSGGYKASEKKKDERLTEERESMDILGMNHLIPLDFPDGQLSKEMFGDLVRAVMHVIDSGLQGGIVYNRLLSFGPEGYSGHPDHILVAQAVEYVFKLRDQIRELHQVVMSPDQRRRWPGSWDLGVTKIIVPQPDIQQCVPVDVSGTIFQKIKAIKAHHTQYDGDNGGSVQIGRVRNSAPVEYWRVYTRT